MYMCGTRIEKVVPIYATNLARFLKCVFQFLEYWTMDKVQKPNDSDCELSVVYKNDPFSNTKSIFALCNLLKENKLENILPEVHKPVEVSPNTTSLNPKVRIVFQHSRTSK
jgi:hypothetical protein